VQGRGLVAVPRLLTDLTVSTGLEAALHMLSAALSLATVTLGLTGVGKLTLETATEKAMGSPSQQRS